LVVAAADLETIQLVHLHVVAAAVAVPMDLQALLAEHQQQHKDEEAEILVVHIMQVVVVVLPPQVSQGYPDQ
jgi:hypothetical protein